MVSEVAQPRTVRFGRRPARGVLLGLGMLRVGTLGAALGLLTAAVYVRGVPGVAITAPIWLLLVASALVSVAGRPVVEWAPIVGHWLLRRALRQNVYRVRPLKPRPAGTLALPGDAAGLRVYDDATSGAAMIHDPHARRLSVVLRVEHPAFVMLGAADQNGRSERWGRVLAGLCQSGRIARVQVLEAAVPDSGRGVADWWSAHGVADGSGPATAYAELVAEAGPTAERHSTLLPISLDMHAARRAIRAEGGGLRGAAAVLRHEMSTINEALHAADLSASAWLDGGELAGILRVAFDPSTATVLDQGDVGHILATAGPLGVREHWDHVQVDGAFHTVLWISEWPRSEVPIDFLHALLVRLSGVHRTVSIVYEPLSVRQALAQIHKERTGHATDATLRQRTGQLEDFATTQEWADVERRERELVSGHGDLRFAGLIAVSAGSRDQLVAAQARVQQAAMQSGCETRVLYGQQAQALVAAALPFGRGI